MTRYNNILETIGDTPLVRLSRLAPEGVNVYVKVEAFNPMGSVKDRMARAVIEHAERSGELSPGQTVIEATSGNTGIALAMVCAQKGYPLVVIMAENSSVERRKIMRFLGAQVILTPAADKGTGMLAKAVELAEAHGYYLCQQFDNEVNAAVHTSTTGPEILRDMGGEPLHYWLSGFGTGGTLKGVARFLKSESPNTRIVATEPDNSPVLASGIAQPRDAQGNATVSHPSFRPHPMQGWSPDFISGLTESAFAENWVDQVLPVAGDDAMRLCRELACKEGIFAGITGGATLAGALQIAADAPRGTNIVCMLPDTGERYLSTPLFADIGEDMNQEEISLSRSTAGYQFETAQPEKVAPAPAPAPVPAPAPAETVTLDVEAKELVDSLVANEGVVMFALEWCEFCWSVRKLLEAMGVEYRSIDLDSVAYQAGDQGGKIRQVLADTLKSPTIPQIFVAGEHIGGATDLIAGCEDGSLQRRLDKAGISYVPELSMSPAEFLPQWLHPRKRA